MHALPRRDAKGGGTARAAEMGHRAAGGAFPGHDRRVDLRARAGGTQSHYVRDQVFSAGAGRMNAPYEKALDVERTEFFLNGVELSAERGETIIQAAKRHGVDIPHLCYKEGMRADGNCRACMVEIKGERVLAPSCCRAPTAGMEVSSDSPRAVHAQKLVIEMLVADVPQRVYKLESGLVYWN